MNRSPGQTLVEMVVAVGMVSLVLVAVVSGIALSVRNSRFSKNKSLATRFAQEGIEKFRWYRDEFGWAPFLEEMNSGGTYCLADLPDSLVGLSSIKSSCTTEKIGTTEYKREAVVSVTLISPYVVDVAMNVSWIEGAADHFVELPARFNARTKK